MLPTGDDARKGPKDLGTQALTTNIPFYSLSRAHLLQHSSHLHMKRRPHKAFLPRHRRQTSNATIIRRLAKRQDLSHLHHGIPQRKRRFPFPVLDSDSATLNCPLGLTSAWKPDLGGSEVGHIDQIGDKGRAGELGYGADDDDAIVADGGPDACQGGGCVVGLGEG